MNKIYFSFLAIFFSSCFPHINYIGNSFPSTKEPEFFVDERSIDKPYKIIGKGYPNGIGMVRLKTLQKKAIEKAKKNGADAVLVQDYFVQAAVGSSTIYHADGHRKGVTGSSTVSTGDGVDTQFVILFLKYTEQ